jgi:N-acetylneuraminate synthase
MLGHRPLLNKIAAEGKLTYISTGMSTLEEIEEVVNLFREKNCPFELMHCNSTYPMKEEDANLACIPMLREKFHCNVGYSGHESSLIKVCVAAVALGATSIERHITLDRTMYGSDQAASIEAHSLGNFVESVRAVPGILGTGKKVLSQPEEAARNKLRITIN